MKSGHDEGMNFSYKLEEINEREQALNLFLKFTREIALKHE